MDDGVDFDGKERKLEYGLPDMHGHNIEENMLLLDLLHLICSNPGAVNYFNLPEVERERSNRFMEAYYARCKADQL